MDFLSLTRADKLLIFFTAAEASPCVFFYLRNGLTIQHFSPSVVFL